MVYHVVGCFCGLPCAAAYNFASREAVDERLTRYALINALSIALGNGTGAVRPAPDRIALAMFGGCLTIDEFRAHSDPAQVPDGQARAVLVHQPPMQTLTQQVEEVPEAALRSEYRYVPLDTERVNRFQEKVRLRRTKPLVNFKNTLEHTMKLRFQVEGDAGGA